MKEKLQAISKIIRAFLIVVLMSGTLILSGCGSQNKSPDEINKSQNRFPTFCFWTKNCSPNVQFDQSQHLPEKDIEKTEKKAKIIISRDDLRGADLTGVDLPGANLRGRNLNGVKLSGADLHDAKLQGTKLIEADLSGADLRNANLSGADLTGANLNGADLTGANLEGTKMPT